MCLLFILSCTKDSSLNSPESKEGRTIIVESVVDSSLGTNTMTYPDGRSIIKNLNGDTVNLEKARPQTLSSTEQEGFYWEDIPDGDGGGSFPPLKVQYFARYQINEYLPFTILNVLNAWVSLSNFSDYAPDYGGDPYNGTYRTQSIIGSQWWVSSPLPATTVTVNYKYFLNCVYQKITNGQVTYTYTRQYDRSGIRVFP